MGMEYGGTRRGQTSRNECWGYDVTPIETVGSSFLTIRERYDHLALLTVVPPELEVAIQANQLCLVPPVVKHAILPEHPRQPLDDIQHEPAVLAREGDGDREASGLSRATRHGNTARLPEGMTRLTE